MAETVLTEAQVKAIESRFSLRPRCCDWCNHRGTKIAPLIRLYIESNRLTKDEPEPYHWWVHKPCAEMILEDETISTHLYL